MLTKEHEEPKPAVAISFLFIDTERVWRGGQDQLYTLLRGLAARGHDVHLVCHPGTLLEARTREAGIEVHTIRIRSEVGPTGFLKMFTLMRKMRFDIVAFNTPRSILLGNLASRLCGVRHRIIFRRVNFPLKSNPFTRLKYRWGIDCIVAISESIRHQLEKGGVESARIFTIYEGLDLDGFSRNGLPRAPWHGRPVVIGTVAYLSPEKGHAFLVEAARLIPRVASRIRFAIVGDGGCRSTLEDQVRKYGLQDCFEFRGFQSQISDQLNSFDIFVLPSLSEGLSSAILSAMSASLPVIATAVGGIPELVHHGENGLLVPPADPTALADAIERLTADPEESVRMGRCGRHLVEERFTLERKIQETEALCLSLLSRHPPMESSAHA